MKKLRISFNIQSTESNNKFETFGEYDNNRLKFTDNEGNKNYIIFHKDMIEYFKRGTTNMKYKFSMDEITSGEYRIPGFNFTFQVETTKMEITETSLDISFQLYQDNEIVNKTKLYIEYTVRKEDI